MKDTGIRDEHGLEPIDGIFSSPEKSPSKRNGTTENATIVEEEDMDIGQSMQREPQRLTTPLVQQILMEHLTVGTIPEPTEVLIAHHTRRSRTILPPPRARSPIKTTLNSSPRRSVGPMSSPARRSNDTPSRATSQPLVNRKLEFSVEEAQPTIQRSPAKGRRLSSSSARGSNKLKASFGRGKKRTFDLRASVNGDQEGEEESTIRDASAMNVPDNDASEESNLLNNEIESFRAEEDESLEMIDHEETQQYPPPLDEMAEIVEQQKPGRKRKGVPGELMTNKTISVEHEIRQAASSIIKRGRGRPPKAAPIDVDAPQLPAPEAKPLRVADAKLGKGRPAKTAKTDVFREQDTEEAEASQGPTKRARHTSVDATPTVKRKVPKPPPSQRDPNARVISARKPVGKTATAESMGPPQAPGRPKARSLYVLRSETPADDSGARVLRSGRTSVKPMAFWRNERIVYGDRTSEGSMMVLPGIKEVIRTEEVEQPRPKRPPGRRTGSRKKRQLDDLDEEDEDQEPWEAEETPIMRGDIIQWDPTIGKGNEDLIEETGQ